MLLFFFSLDVTNMFLIGEPDVVKSLYLRQVSETLFLFEQAFEQR